MARIFLTGSGATKGYATGSGIITNPARILLQERDNATGSYPTIARTGDPDFTGQYTSTFDDTNTIIFSGGNLVYPTNLPASSKFVSGGVATPNILQGLTAVGTSSAGTADIHVSFTPGENISPFDESRIYIDNDAEFYATGTASGTLPGFSQRLSSKTSFTIDINPTTSTDVVFSTGTLPNASGYDEGVNSGIAYFNFADKRWEVIGDLTTGSNVDYFNPDRAIVSSSMLANIANLFGAYTVPNSGALPFIQFSRPIGGPTDLAGFPYAQKFNATGSQLFNTSGILNSPFLLEKISVEFSGTLATRGLLNEFSSSAGGRYDIPIAVMNSSFVLMLQREQKISSTQQTEFLFTTSSGGGLPFGDFSSSSIFQVNRDRRIISYGRIGKYLGANSVPSPSNPADTVYGFSSPDEIRTKYPQAYESCDLWLSGGSDIHTLFLFGSGGERLQIGNNAITGTFKLNFVPKTPALASKASIATDRSQTGDINAVNSLGRQNSGRDLRDSSDGRSFIKSSIGNTIDFITQSAGYAFNRYAVDSEESPFVLLPGDKLILAHVNQPQTFVNPLFPSLGESGIANFYKNTLSPGAGKITLFGSLLQDNLPKEPESNQPLTSDAIHEDLHYDNPVYDQWDVEPFAALTGSYTDLVITGSMLAQNSSGEYADPEAPNVRKVQASVAAGQAGTTGSLQRFVRLTAEEGKVYDSYPPNPAEIIKAAGKGYWSNVSTTFVSLAVGVPSGNIFVDAAGGILSGVDGDWYLRTAYETISQRSVFDTVRSSPGEGFDENNNSTGQGLFPTYPDTVLIFGAEFETFMSGGASTDSQFNLSGEATRRERTKWLFGFGDLAYNLPTFTTTSILTATDQVLGPALIRGYKYGLGGLFGSLPDARFRRDRYGQFRDMLEQRRFPATLVGGIVEYPVEIKFVPQDSTTGGSEDPARTHSQNLSPFATSSLPYYDGQVKDRADNPDVTLTPIEVSV